jgi:hypothetical protein
MADGTLAAEDEPTVGAEVLEEFRSTGAGAGSFNGSDAVAAAPAVTEVVEVIRKALLERSSRVMHQAQPVLANGSSIRGPDRKCMSIAR